MQIRCTKPWLTIDAAALDALPGQLGIFEFADATGSVIFIGRADARSLFGLRSEVALRAAESPTRAHSGSKSPPRITRATSSC